MCRKDVLLPRLMVVMEPIAVKANRSPVVPTSIARVVSVITIHFAAMFPGMLFAQNVRRVPGGLSYVQLPAGALIIVRMKTSGSLPRRKKAAKREQGVQTEGEA